MKSTFGFSLSRIIFGGYVLALLIFGSEPPLFEDAPVSSQREEAGHGAYRRPRVHLVKERLLSSEKRFVSERPFLSAKLIVRLLFEISLRSRGLFRLRARDNRYFENRDISTRVFARARVAVSTNIQKRGQAFVISLYSLNFFTEFILFGLFRLRRYP